ncbi:MAG: hypothetical protein IJX67_03290 [Oscillospiraceae bacterium]|nr:hypothetical protein [Oscillospiraceae bacterium]
MKYERSVVGCKAKKTKSKYTVTQNKINVKKIRIKRRNTIFTKARLACGAYIV